MRKDLTQHASHPAAGVTLTELLVALVVAGLVSAAALSVTLSSRRLYEMDRHRTNVNQNLRSALDLIGVDVRQAGERLPSDFPSLEIVDGGGGAPDTLIVRRNLIDAVLPLCEQIDLGTLTSSVRVATSTGTPPPGCDPVADDNADGWPDNIERWRDFRDAGGGAVTAYVFNPIGRTGEFFVYDGDGTTSDFLHKGNGDSWQFTYLVSQQCRVYMIEERAYRLDGELLQFTLDGDPSNAVNLVSQVNDFQARAFFADGTVQDSLDATDDWGDLRSIEISFTGLVAYRGRTIDRTVSARYFPRNVLSL